MELNQSEAMSSDEIAEGIGGVTKARPGRYLNYLEK